MSRFCSGESSTQSRAYLGESRLSASHWTDKKQYNRLYCSHICCQAMNFERCVRLNMWRAITYQETCGPLAASSGVHAIGWKGIAE